MSLSRNLKKKKEVEDKFSKTGKRSLLLEGFYVDACQEKPHPRECSVRYCCLSFCEKTLLLSSLATSPPMTDI